MSPLRLGPTMIDRLPMTRASRFCSFYAMRLSVFMVPGFLAACSRRFSRYSCAIWNSTLRISAFCFFMSASISAMRSLMRTSSS